MVEAKARKSAFLSEAVRVLGLGDAFVANRRFEELAADPDFRAKADLVTVRAVRPDSALFKIVHDLVNAAGRLLLFRGSTRNHPETELFHHVESALLLEKSSSHLDVYRPVFHVEQSR
jgi:16S rRNA G527 N7-methylase RsmG